MIQHLVDLLCIKYSGRSSKEWELLVRENLDLREENKHLMEDLKVLGEVVEGLRRQVKQLLEKA